MGNVSDLHFGSKASAEKKKKKKKKKKRLTPENVFFALANKLHYGCFAFPQTVLSTLVG